MMVFTRARVLRSAEQLAWAVLSEGMHTDKGRQSVPSWTVER